MPRPLTSDEDRRHGERLGQLLRTARTEDGRSAQQVATDARLSVDTLRSLESGRVPTPSFVTVAKVASALRLSLDELQANAAVATAAARRPRGRRP